jgi:small subunit ribosomal protein S9
MATAATSERKKGTGDSLGTGRRKTSVARVRVRVGSGQIEVNGRPFEEYFVNERDRLNVMAPLMHTDRVKSVDVVIKVHGGGISGQSGAVKMGLARALKIYDSGLEEMLRQHNLLTRDGRMKERKHYGLRGARKGTQFSKR